MLTAKFRCPECGATPLRDAGDNLLCDGCGHGTPLVDGIVDFVGGRFDTALDVEAYDAGHGIQDHSSERHYNDLKILAGHRWPGSLGSVVEIGCGTGLYSRALASRGEARELLLTDVSVGMLRLCRKQLERDATSSRMPIDFATYSSNETCFRDAVFDTCAGTSVLHHIPDVRSVLADIFRALKPGGRAYFLEPNQRHDRALGQTLAGVLAILYARDAEGSEDKHRMLNLIAESRRRLLHQDDRDFMATLEDKHMFIAEAFEAMALELGFATAEAIPTRPGENPAATARELCHEVGASPGFTDIIAGLAGTVGGRYFDLLSPRDRSPSLLLWLTKGVGPQARTFQAPPAPRAVAPGGVEAVLGGMPPHWRFNLHPQATPDGIRLRLSGWCLLNVDVRWIRVTLNNVAQDAPLWLPRPDVHLALNKAGLYGAWNALCCGLDSALVYPGVQARNDELSVAIEIVLCDGNVLSVKSQPTLRLDQPAVVAV
jgi:ubiquinone/menaquinone biosynthesis C-methylase UbiE